jgi:hypothetical protein
MNQATALQNGFLTYTDFQTFNNKQNALTLTTTGTSGAATLVGATLNIPNYAPDLSGYVTLATTQTISGAKTFSAALVGTSASFISTAKVLEVKQSAAGSATYYVFDNTIETTGKKWRFGYTGAVADAGTFSLYNETDNVVNFVAKGGNLGLGVTPSAGWVQGKALEVGFVGSAIWGRYANEVHMTMNYYYSTSANARVYASTNAASDYEQYNGQHAWYSAPSGTIGTNVSLTQYMTLFSDGNLLLTNGTVSNAGYKLDVNGTGRFSGAVTFGSSISVPSSSSSGQGYVYFNYTSDANSRTWRLANDYNVYGDFQLQQSTTQTGTTFSKILGFTSTGAATFSSSVTATSFFESSDSRLKTLIQDNYQTKGIASITPKLYTKNGKVELGYYAQDFVGILDSAVSKGSDDMLSLSYREVLVAKVYALEQRIKELENN